MDRITESLLDEFSREHDISGLPQDKRFEHFASYVTVRRQYSETFETEEIVTGAGGDIGIDAIAIIINGNLVTDHDSLTEMITDSDHLDVMFIFVQASRSMGFEAAKIGSFSFGVLDFFSSQPRLPRNDAVKEAASYHVRHLCTQRKIQTRQPLVPIVLRHDWQMDGRSGA